MSEVITKNRAALEDRLRLLLQEYLDECSPASWPKPIEGIGAQQQRFWAKKHGQELLREMCQLQTLLRNAPQVGARDDNSEMQQLIRDAKRRGAELRERAGLTTKEGDK